MGDNAYWRIHYANRARIAEARVEALEREVAAKDAGPQPDEMVRFQRDLDAAEQEVTRLRDALEDIKLRYDEEGKFAARDMWRTAYEALEMAASPRAGDGGAEGVGG